jgi:hypothetical protein
VTVVRWILLLTSVIVYRVWFPEGPPPLHVRLDYDLVVIALVALYRGPGVGAAVGWLIGFLSFAPDPGRLAWGSLFGSLLGWVIGHWSQRLFLEHLRSRWIILASGFLAYKILFTAIILAGDWGAWVVSLAIHSIPSALIDATAGVFIGAMWERSRASRAPRAVVSRPAYPEDTPWGGEGPSGV